MIAPHTSSREQFAITASQLVSRDDDVAVVYAEISGQYFGEARRRRPERVINVGIREQLLVNVGAGFALSGVTPIVHTFGSFLAERAFEQIKLGFAHQGVGGVLVGALGSFDAASSGRTHQSPGDVALMSTIPGMSVHAPSTPSEVDAVLRAGVADGGLHYVRVVEQKNRASHLLDQSDGFHVVRRGADATVIALGPVLDAVLAATVGRDINVLYASRVLPFDAATLRSVVTTPEVILVEPWLAGTSAYAVSNALRDVPHRLLSLGVGHDEVRRYGKPQEHISAHGLDAAGIAKSIDRFLG